MAKIRAALQALVEAALPDLFAKRFLRAAGMSMALKLSWAILSYVSVLLLAKWLTGEDYGIYAIILSNVTFLSIACGLGAQTAVVRFIGQYQAQDKHGLAHGVLAYSLRKVLLTAIGCTILSWIVIGIGSALGLISDPVVYIIGLAMLPAFTLINVQASAARALGRVVTALAPRDILWRVGIIVLSFAITSYLPVGQQLFVLILASTLLMSFLSWMQQVILKRALPAHIRDAPEETDAAGWRRVALPIWIASVAMVSLRTLDVITLGFVLPKEEVGWYFAASRTAALVGFLLMTVNMVVGPEIARAYHKGDSELLARVLRMAVSLTFLPAFGIFLAILLFGDRILAIFGPQFVSMRLELAILALGQLVSAGAGCTGLVLDMTGHERINTRILIVTSLLSSLSIVVAALPFGSLGVAIASGAGLAAWNVWRWAAARRLLGLDTSIFCVFRRPGRGKPA